MYLEFTLSQKYHNLSIVDIIDVDVDNIYMNNVPQLLFLFSYLCYHNLLIKQKRVKEYFLNKEKRKKFFNLVVLQCVQLFKEAKFSIAIDQIYVQHHIRQRQLNCLLCMPEQP